VTDKVADASAIAAILFLEPGYEAMEEALSGCEIYAPVLIRIELACVCLKKIKTRQPERGMLLDAFAGFAEFGVRESDVNFTEVIEIAEAAQLSLYDASYLWLAAAMGIELVTLDERLAKVATAI